MEDTTYYLKILFPSSNKWENAQAYKETIVAREIGHSNGSILFYNGDGELIAVYPSAYTIITMSE